MKHSYSLTQSQFGDGSFYNDLLSASTLPGTGSALRLSTVAEKRTTKNYLALVSRSVTATSISMHVQHIHNLYTPHTTALQIFMKQRHVTIALCLPRLQAHVTWITHYFILTLLMMAVVHLVAYVATVPIIILIASSHHTNVFVMACQLNIMDGLSAPTLIYTHCKWWTRSNSNHWKMKMQCYFSFYS